MACSRDFNTARFAVKYTDDEGTDHMDGCVYHGPSGVGLAYERRRVLEDEGKLDATVVEVTR